MNLESEEIARVRVDLAVTTFHSDFHLFRNESETADNGWLLVDLEGDPFVDPEPSVGEEGETPCSPDCESKECGPDGCGGSCGNGAMRARTGT